MFRSTRTHLGHLTLILATVLCLLVFEAQCFPPRTSTTSTGTAGKSSLLSPRSSSTSTTSSANPNVEITVHNNLDTDKTLYIYITGLTTTDSGGTSTGSTGSSSNSSAGSQAILKTDGTWDVLDANGSEIPVNITADVAFRVAAANSSKTTITLPSYVSSARLYVFEDAELQWQMVTSTDTGATTIVQPVVTDPGTTAYDNRWGFVEFTSSEDEFFVNLSFVDFVSLGLGISVVDDEMGERHTVPGLSTTLKNELEEEAGGSQSSSASSTSSNTTATTSNVLESICSALKAQSQEDGNAWHKLCVYSSSSSSSSSSLLRILSPQGGLAQNISFANSSYYDAYISRVWSYYSSSSSPSSSSSNSTSPLYINTQNPELGTSESTAGLIPCTVSPATDQLSCTGSSTDMARPTTADIWGCNSGAFAISETDDDVFRAVVPRVCAAFTRSTFFVPGGGVQPGPANTTFYEAEVTNHYARIVHEHEGVGGYAFSYDDVGVNGEDQEGAIQVASARRLNVYVG